MMKFFRKLHVRWLEHRIVECLRSVTFHRTCSTIAWFDWERTGNTESLMQFHDQRVLHAEAEDKLNKTQSQLNRLHENNS